MLSDILVLLGWWILSIFKFLFVPFLYIQSTDGTLNHWIISILITSTGGGMGAIIFFHLSTFFFNVKRNSNGNKINKTKRKIIEIKQRWGLKGILLISAFISVPLAAIITAKFYKHSKGALTLLIWALAAWSIILSSFGIILKYFTLSL